MHVDQGRSVHPATTPMITMTPHFQTMRPVLALWPLLGLMACGPNDGEAVAATTATAATAVKAAPERPMIVAAASATPGSIDIVVGGKTVNRNSRGDAGSVQCQLSFKATNNSALKIKSMIVNYDAVRADSGAVVKRGWQLVIPVAIPPGESGAPFGTEPIDNERCENLKLQFGPQPGYQCRTETKAACAAFRYKGSVVAVEDRA
jgi:hypothetical protein